MTLRRFLRFSLALCLVIGPTLLRAQEHAPVQPPPAAHEAAPAEHGAAPAEHGTPAPEAHGAVAADPHGAPAAGHGTAHHGPSAKDVALKFLNFGIFFFAIFFLLKGALSAAFKARSKEIQEQLAQAEKDKAEAALQIQELEGRMAGLETELSGIMAKAEADAEVEKQRIIEAARLEAVQIQAQTQQEIEHQKRLAEQELRALVAELATQAAGQRLQSQLQGAAAAPVLDRAIEQIGKIGGAQ